MSVDQIAVATAVVSTTVGALSLLLAWYRGSTSRQPRLAWTLGGVTLVSALAAIVAIGFARTGDESPESTRPRSLTADEYRLRLARLCDDHTKEAKRIEVAEGQRPVLGLTVQLETQTTVKIRTLRAPAALESDHRALLVLWSRRVSLLAHYWDRWREEHKDPAFIREFQRALKRVEELTGAVRARFTALRAGPECDDLFR